MATGPYSKGMGLWYIKYANQVCVCVLINPIFSNSHGFVSHQRTTASSCLVASHLPRPTEDVEEGDIIGSGGFSNIVEVKNFKGSTESLETAGTIPTYVSHPKQKGQHRRNSSWSSDCSQQSYVLKKMRKDIRDKEAKACARVDLAVEAQFLQTLSHPNIVSLHGLGEEPGNEDFFIIIERIDRTLAREMYTWRSYLSNLKHKSKKEAKADLKFFMEDRIAYARQLTCALKYLHSKNILFRDLKPENIGLDFENNIKLFDFGLAKELKNEHRFGPNEYYATSKTGTKRYMSPEVYSEDGVYGLPADVYSFSVILWEMLSLQTPYEGLSPEAHAIQTYVKKSRPKLRNRKWPEDVKKMIKEGWHHKPSQRPQISVIHETLTAYLKSKGWESH